MVEGLVEFGAASVRNRKGESKMSGTEYGKNNLWKSLITSGLLTSILLLVFAFMCLVFVLIK